MKLYTGLKTHFININHHGYYNELRRTYGPGFVEDVKHWKKLGINL